MTPTSDRPGPREVQSRIRSGADAEQVAQQTGLDVDYVRRFEGPVLAERAHVADLARATAVDRGGDPTLTLERVVQEVLTGEGHDVDDITWDSRRSDGTRWEVLVLTGEGPVRSEATWSFDTGTRSLEPVDAEAERLTGVERRRRLSAVRDTVFDVERPAAAAPRSGTVDLLDALARQRGRRPTPPAAGATPADPASGASDEDEDSSAVDGAVVDGAALTGAADATGPDADGSAPGTAAVAQDGAATARTTGASAEGQGSPGPAAPSRLVGLRPAARPERHDGDLDRAAASIEPDLLSELELDGTGDASPAPARPAAVASGDRRSRRRRAAVPSWDEIVFGAKREDG